MSLSLIVKVMDERFGSPARKLVMIKLADNANDDGECWPSYGYIARHCEMSRRSVMTHISKLESLGFLEIIRRKDGEKNKSNLFRLTLGSEISSPGSEISSPGVVKYSHPEPVNIEPVIEPKKTDLSKKIKFVAPGADEVKEFACKNNIVLDGFWDYYESIGWMVGKRRMVKWKAAARGWASRQKSFRAVKTRAAETPLDRALKAAKQRSEARRGERWT